MEALLEDFPVITEVPVAWGEMDALQHVNNVVYFRYFESARLDYFNRLELMEKAKETGIGPVLSHAECFFKIPVTHPDTLLIGSRVSDIQDDRLTMEYRIVSKKLGKVTTTGKATAVMFNFKTGTKANLSDDVKEAINSIENQ
ncbi:thioesterase family protein [uncultured Endozoicomonas sp.]|uniref:acyl-CoA thioesterase n=1 Tax=uncultured Endozoicomonas sp. TaxID=432652 RepID=UPI00260C9B4E|nr:thioesterase family protein [uncultured Endozoicomonas sp.]